MSQDNQITLRGFVTAEPKLRQTVQTATPVADIRVGSTPRRLNRETGEWQDAPTSYYTVKAWRRLAINAKGSLHKGDMVVVRGRFYMNHWVDSQQRPRATLEIEADSLGHDLAYGWSNFLRGTASQPGRPAGVSAGELARQDMGSSDPDDSDDEYLADSDPGESQDADPLAATSVTLVTPVTESDGGNLEPGDLLAAPGLTDDAGRPEMDAVPF
jgi:single-strand DNA-binding protein